MSPVPSGTLEISTDPMVESCGLYAFTDPSAVTVVAGYGRRAAVDGPGEFGDDVLYEIHLDVDGDGRPDLTYQFRFRTELRDDRTFLYNTGPIESLASENWNRRQFYSVTTVDRQGKSAVVAQRLACPPCNVGPHSTPDYERLAAAAVHTLDAGETVFAGQRAGAAGGNVHGIAVRIPLGRVARLGDPAAVEVWTTAGRRGGPPAGRDRTRSGAVRIGGPAPCPDFPHLATPYDGNHA